MTLKRTWINLALFTLFLFIVLYIFNLKEDYSRWMTYRNFDIPGAKNFIYYMLPGIKDTSSRTSYSFTKKHWGALLGVFFILFPVMGAARLYYRKRNFKGSSQKTLSIAFKRGISQLFFFVLSRMGIFRVSGVCPVKRSALGIFPYINCQSCELASGGCALGMLQMALLKHTLPLFTLGIMLGSGLIFGRFICGWLCPFGFLSEIFDRISLHKRLPRWIHHVKFIVFGIFLITLVIIATFPGIGFLPFCAFLCPAGVFYGTVPFTITTGLAGFLKTIPHIHIMALYHIAFGAFFLILVRRYTGWIFCISFCPLGAFLSLFNKIALVRIIFKAKKCDKCGICKRHCPTMHDPIKRDFVQRSACISCGNCTKVCPKGALQFSIGGTGVSEVKKTLKVQEALPALPETKKKSA